MVVWLAALAYFDHLVQQQTTEMATAVWRGVADVVCYGGFFVLGVRFHERRGVLTVRQRAQIQEGIPQEKAKEVVKFIKDTKAKVQASIQGEQVRVTSPSKDDLQEAIRTLREQDFGVALHFGNYR